MNKQTDLKKENTTILLCLYLADPATFLDSNSVLLTFSPLWEQHVYTAFLIIIVNVMWV